MAAENHSRLVDRQLSFCRVQLSAAAQAAAQKSENGYGGSPVTVLSYHQAAIWQLGLAMRYYLAEISGLSPQFQTSISSLLVSDLTTADARLSELQLLLKDRASWLSQLVVLTDLCHKPDVPAVQGVVQNENLIASTQSDVPESWMKADWICLEAIERAFSKTVYQQRELALEQ